MGRWLKKNLATLILLIIMTAGLCLLLYPTVADWWNSYHQSRAIASYVEALGDIDKDKKEEMLRLAAEYNQRLSTDPGRWNPNEAALAEYNSLLNITGNGIMGYIQINKIGVSLPLYHGTEEAVLQVAIGHLIGTSLPVGGESTHCAVSGHRGLPSAKLFTDLDKLTEGDTFTVNVLDQTITYQVDQIHIVEPEQMSDLEITTGADYMTLVTCTPYGVNTHRMLVRGHRIENLRGEIVVTAEGIRIPNYIVALAVGVPMLFVLLVWVLIAYGRKRPTAESILMEMEQQAQEQQEQQEQQAMQDEPKQS